MAHKKAAIPKALRRGCESLSGYRLGFFDQTGFDGLDAYPHALHLAGREAYFDSLYIRAEFAGRGFGHVRANSATLLGLSLAVNSASRGGTFSGNCANSSHD